jgi:uncharacterized protein involved in propanediol utilization
MFKTLALPGAFELPQVGHGSCIAHHGEILQGVFPGPGGSLHRGLVTLPCHQLRSIAVFHPQAGNGLSVSPAWRVKALSAARLALSYLDLPLKDGVLTIHADIPVGWGLGSSTSDVIAAVRAVTCAFQRRLAPELLAKIAVQAEVASDSVMFEDRPILFAQRDGLVLEELPLCLPPLEVLGVNTDDGGGVDTLLMRPAEYSQWEVEAFRPLLGLLRRALHNQDAKLLGRVASASARINQRHFPKLCFDRLERLAVEAGAVGLQVAHSGSVIGVLFDGTSPDRKERIEAARSQVTGMGFDEVWHFTTRGDELLPQFLGGPVVETAAN